MPAVPPIDEAPPLPGEKPGKKKRGLPNTLRGCGMLLLAGVIALFCAMWPFHERSRRADNFARYIKPGYTVSQVFAGPRAWDSLWVNCTVAGKDDERASIKPREGGAYVVVRFTDHETKTDYPDFDAMVSDLAVAAGPFAGRNAISLAYRYYMVSGTFVLTLGSDGRVAKIERISRG